MSAEQIQAFERDYIRLTERFKALSTFGQFLQEIHRAFLPVLGGHSFELGSLYEEVKALPGRLDEKPPERVAERIRTLDAKLDAAALELRTEEMTLSPSLTRRYFEKVRPADERIPFYLLRFYLSQSEVDENMLDKVDYLATVAAAGSPDPVAPAARSREEIRALFDRLLAGAAPTPINDEVAPEIVRAFDELASQIGATTEFAHLAGEGQLEALRTLKRRAARGLAHPEILTAVVSCNLTARAVFRRLYEKEERALRAASAALKVLGQGEPEPREKMGNVADEKRPVREDPASVASSRRWRTRRERIRRARPTSISRPGRERPLCAGSPRRPSRDPRAPSFRPPLCESRRRARPRPLAAGRARRSRLLSFGRRVPRSPTSASSIGRFVSAWAFPDSEAYFPAG